MMRIEAMKCWRRLALLEDSLQRIHQPLQGAYDAAFAVQSLRLRLVNFSCDKIAKNV